MILNIYENMDKNTIFAKLFRMTPFSYNVELFIDYMKEQGYSITKSQVNCWQRKVGSDKSRPVPDFVFTMIFNYIHDNKIEVAEFIKSKDIALFERDCEVDRDLLLIKISKS